VFSLQREELEFLRIANLSDAVFAIAMTLLVLTLKVPDLAGRQLGDLGDKLIDQHDQLLAYLLSFAVIARFWLGHHRLFGYLAYADGPFMVFNLVYLAAIAFVPYPTELLGNYASETPALVVYASAMTVTSALSAGLWLLADRRGLLRHEAREHVGASFHLSAFVPTAVFAISIPLAIVLPRAVLYAWLVMLVFRRPAHRRMPGGDRSR
jgi:uncharacterized membrane protein